MTKFTVETHDLRKSFGEVRALDGVSLAAPAGCVLGLLGPNGSGKTTTVSILATSLRPDAGRATVGGLDVVTQAARVRRIIGLAGQFAAVDPNLTGRENLRLIGRLSRLGRRQARVRADELLDGFGLNAAAGRLVRGYSGGMRRRLDEADALADQVVVISGGRVAGTGTPAELKARFGAVVFHLDFGRKEAAEAARTALVSGGYRPEHDGSGLRVRSASGSGELTGMLRALEGRAPDPVSVAVREPTLDDVFLSLTGGGPARTTWTS